MIPYKDDDSGRRRFPFVTIALIVINALVFFLYEMPAMAAGESAFNNLLRDVVLVPASFTANMFSVESWLDMFRSMFMHGSIAHLAGNMLYLWIFGDNVEDVVGHIPYVFFYLFCGVAAAFAHILIAPNSPIPTLGASGAIAGVLGAYLVMFPQNRVLAMVPGGGAMRVQEVPALLILGFWFVLQAINMFMGWAGAGEGGVAFAAHVGGFVAGAALGLLWKSIFGKPDMTRVVGPA
jgi:membrane associated rhomboid family serine protease